MLITNRAVSRRAMLRSAGVGLALPLLNAMTSATARAQSAAAPRRMFAICNNLGLLPDEFFPAKPAPTTRRRITSRSLRITARTSPSSPASRTPTWMAATRPTSAS